MHLGPDKRDSRKLGIWDVWVDGLIRFANEGLFSSTGVDRTRLFPLPVLRSDVSH